MAVVSLLAGCRSVPCVSWPEHRVIVVGAQWDVPPGPEPAADLGAEPMSDFEVTVLARLKAAGAVSVREVAQHLVVPRASALKALQRLGARGLVQVTPEGWRSA